MHDDEKNNIEQLSSVWMFVEGLLARIFKHASGRRGDEEEKRENSHQWIRSRNKKWFISLMLWITSSIILLSDLLLSEAALWMLNTAETEIDKFQLCCCAIFIVPSEGGFFVLECRGWALSWKCLSWNVHNIKRKRWMWKRCKPWIQLSWVQTVKKSRGNTMQTTTFQT